MLISLHEFLCRPISQANHPGADSVYRVHGPAAQVNSADVYSKDWFVFDQSLILPEYIIHFKYLSPVSTQ